MVKNKKVDNKVISEFIQLLEGLERFLAPPLKANTELLIFIRKFRDILSENKDISVSTLLNHIQKLSEIRNINGKPSKLSLKEENLSKMSIQDIELLLEDETLLKNDLISIAEVRFGAPSGTLKRYTIPILKDKLRGMIKNEKSHQSIAKVASSITADTVKDSSQKTNEILKGR